MKTELWEAQKKAFDFLKPLDTPALLMDMGTGKTRVMLGLLEDRQCQRILIVCPLSVVAVWREEIKKHCTLEYEVAALDRGKKVQQLHNAITNANLSHKPLIVIINFESVWRPKFKEVFNSSTWDALIVDESHRIKAPGSKVSKYLSRLGRMVPYRAIMTGTPITNNPLDIYAQYRFLDRGIFGMTYNLFKRKYAIWGGFENRQPVSFINQDDLKTRMHSVAYRMRLEEVIDLEAGIDSTRHGQLEPKARKVYNTLKKDFVALLDDKILSADNTLVKGLRLHQLTGGMVVYDDGEKDIISTAKQKLLLDTLYDLGGQDVVVFARFRHDIDVIRRTATKAGFTVWELSGKFNELAYWQKVGGLLVVQMASGNAGVEMTRACQAIYYSLGYSLGEYEQSRARLRRPGQTRQVHYIHLVLEGTIDELILVAIKKKEHIANYIVNNRKDI